VRWRRPGPPRREAIEFAFFAMDILYLLIPLSVVLAFLVGAAFWWALQSGQFEDLDGPAHRILNDVDIAEESQHADRPSRSLERS